MLVAAATFTHTFSQEQCIHAPHARSSSSSSRISSSSSSTEAVVTRTFSQEQCIPPPPHPFASLATHAHAAPRRTLSFTIASQTIASSPYGSEISSAASSACGTPAATVGAGCRFRASSTVTSSSSPCNHTFGHSRSGARAGRRTREGALCRQQRIPRCVLSRGGAPEE